MDRGRATGHGIGEISSGVSKGDLALKTIQYVRNQLPAWRDDPARPDEAAEERLNAQLCKFLDSHARSEFPMIRFDREEYQMGQRRADLSASPVKGIILEAKAYSIYDPILIVECKRLPAPSRDREREYVTGGERRNGGIQRFKLGLYAAKHDLAAMIGYVQKETARHWHGEINEWISDLASGTPGDECVWRKEERLESLKEEETEGIAVCRSSHGRIGDVRGEKIVIHHLWVILKAAAT